MTVYLASPGSQVQAAALEDMPVLLSFASWRPWMASYQQSFAQVLIDSGAFTELTGGAPVDLEAYKDFARADAVAGLDDIAGDWRRSLRNYEAFPEGFPTFHPGADPPELLEDLVSMAMERPSRWIGLGLVPPREGKGDIVLEALDRIPNELHVHGWALRRYWNTHRRLDSVDSTNWWRDSFKIREALPWITPAQALNLVVLRYRQERRALPAFDQPGLFDGPTT